MTASPDKRLAFLHIFKAGGTTIRQAARATLDGTSLWPVEIPGAGATAEAAARYRFVSGHFPIRLIDDLVAEHGFLSAVQLRDPVDRLKSAYNFWRAHSLDRHPALQDKGSGFHALVSAAKRLSPEMFFQSPHAATARLDNHYVWTLSGRRFEAQGAQRPPAAAEAALTAALERLERFDFVGVTGNALATVNFLRDVFGQPRLDAFRAFKETEDEMRWHEWMEPVALANRAEVETAVAPLVRMDDVLYRRALELNAAHAARIPGGGAT